MAGGVAGALRRAFLPVPAWYLALGGLTALGVLGYSFLPEDSPPRAYAFIALQVSLGLLVVAALRLRPGAAVPVGWVLSVGLLARLLTLPSELIFENDVFRYLWDARVAASGVNPYAHAPAAEALEHLQDDWVFPQIPYRQVPTIYPPVAQLVFLLSRGLFGESVFGLQAVMTLFEAGTLMGLFWLGQRVNAPRAAAAYALHPLAIKELSQAAHVDAAAVMLAVLAAVLLVQRKDKLGMGFLAGAALVKVFPLVLLPALFRRVGVLPLALFALLLALPLGLLALLGPSPLAGFEVFARYWIYNPSAYDLVVRALAAAVPPEVAHTWARPICGVLTLGIVAAIAARFDPRDDRSLLRAMAASIFVLLLLSPAANPWYVAWILPFSLLAGWWPGVLWTLTASVAYAFYVRGEDAPGWRLLEYAPVLGLLLAQALGGWLARPPRQADPRPES